MSLNADISRFGAIANAAVNDITANSTNIISINVDLINANNANAYYTSYNNLVQNVPIGDYGELGITSFDNFGVSLLNNITYDCHASGSMKYFDANA